jgi:hypothetical protein
MYLTEMMIELTGRKRRDRGVALKAGAVADRRDDPTRDDWSPGPIIKRLQWHLPPATCRVVASAMSALPPKADIRQGQS